MTQRRFLLKATRLIAAAFAFPIAGYADGNESSASSGAMFKQLDRNDDGFISREEHAAAHSAAAASSAPAVGPAQSSSECTAEPQPSAPSAPTGERKY
jgi:hypothetical protein